MRRQLTVAERVRPGDRFRPCGTETPFIEVQRSRPSSGRIPADRPRLWVLITDELGQLKLRGDTPLEIVRANN